MSISLSHCCREPIIDVAISIILIFNDLLMCHCGREKCLHRDKKRVRMKRDKNEKTNRKQSEESEGMYKKYRLIDRVVLTNGTYTILYDDKVCVWWGERCGEGGRLGSEQLGSCVGGKAAYVRPYPRGILRGFSISHLSFSSLPLTPLSTTPLLLSLSLFTVPFHHTLRL